MPFNEQGSDAVQEGSDVVDHLSLCSLDVNFEQINLLRQKRPQSLDCNRDSLRGIFLLLLKLATVGSVTDKPRTTFLISNGCFD